MRPPWFVIVPRMGVLLLVLSGCGSSAAAPTVGAISDPAVSSAPTAVATAAPTQTADTSLQVVILGDSIGIPKMGCGTCVGFDQQYKTWLEKQTGRNVVVHNEARPNAQIKDLKTLLDMNVGVQAEVSRADIVIVTIGYNNGPNWDVTDPCHAPEAAFDGQALQFTVKYLNDACVAQTLAAFKTQLNVLYGRIEKLAAGRPQVRISLGVYANLDGNPGGDGTIAKLSAGDLRAAIDRYNAIIAEWNVMDCAAATPHGFVCGDIFHAFNGPEGTNSVKALVNPDDYVHPNVAGQAKIAELLEAIDVRRVISPA